MQVNLIVLTLQSLNNLLIARYIMLYISREKINLFGKFDFEIESRS